MSINQTNKNHFVPCFYTRQWTGSDGRLCQFTRPYAGVVPKRVFPEATGYSKKLYTEDALPLEIQSYLEDVFLKKVDQRACDALQILINKHPDDLSDEQKTAWVRFIMSMLQRSPRTIASLTKRWDEQFLTIGLELEERYQRERGADDPPTVQEFLIQTPPDVRARGRVQLLQAVMDLPNLGHHILNMRWGVYRVNTKKFTFLTSDRPVVKSNNLLEKDGHIGLPITPTVMFLAANGDDFLRYIQGMDTNDFVRQTNVIAVRQAEQFVYGINDRALRFIEKHFARHRAAT